MIKDRKILVTGAGSVGRNLVSRFLEEEAGVIRILENDETRLSKAKEKFKDKRCRFLMGDIRDKERVSRAMEDIDIVVHTAAMKHVDISEYNPFEAVKTNVIGLQNIVDASIDNDVNELVFTSSDKAVYPANTMGATKLVGEKLFSAGNAHKGERDITFSSVRFGNVINSSQSVIPVFKRQIKDQGQIELTNENMTRFFLTFDEVSDLIIDSLKMAEGGEIFVRKMRAMRIEDLADAIVDLYAPQVGKNPEDIQKKIIGRRPGETLHEHIMTEKEAERALENGKTYAIPPDKSTRKILNYEKLEGFNNADKVVTSSENAEKLRKKEIKKLLEV